MRSKRYDAAGLGQQKICEDEVSSKRPPVKLFSAQEARSGDREVIHSH
ncbi:MAG: hypothetical protein ICV68_14010 [Pyrinomonadaceae bacterium]|nr:hypothetical protein [Pyrinomonadaceae bacterium]